MRRFIRGSSYEMRNGLIIKGNPKVIRSQFVRDFIRLNSIERGKIGLIILQKLENWEQNIKLKNHFVVQLPEDYEYNEDVYYYVKKIIDF